jgi:hypothetical protein
MEWDRLISDYLDNALTPQEVEALFQWIGSHPDNARRFARAAFLHRSLEVRLSAMHVLGQTPNLADTDSPELLTPDAKNLPSIAPHNTPASPEKPVSDSRNRHSGTGSLSHWRRWGAIAAGLLLIVGVLAFIAWPRRSNDSTAHLSAAENATWGPGRVPAKTGEPLPSGDWVLNSGHITLGFDNGNQVTIEGPAHFAVTNALAVKLDQGTLTAVVTRTGRGFQVSTPTARVTDLGTEFGVQVSSTKTLILVIHGKVAIDNIVAGTHLDELLENSAVEVSAAGTNPVSFDPTVLRGVRPSPVRPLDLIDLMAGGDGTGSASGIGIDAATGKAHETKAVTIRLGDHQYVRVKDNRVLDGSFIPGGEMPVDSTGHVYAFPSTTLISYGLIWTGPDVPWEGTLPLATSFPGEDAGKSTSRVLVMHSNNAITLNLDAIRALHNHSAITGFRARVGNSYRPAGPDGLPTNPLASIHVIVDGAARFEKLSFASTDLPFDVTCALSGNDHFLTLATTDGGDGNSCDWVLWTHPELTVREAEN